MAGCHVELCDRHTLGIRAENLRWRTHSDQERSFYSQQTVDLEYCFPFGFKELWGIAYRTDYDLRSISSTPGATCATPIPAPGGSSSRT
jgi:glycyl-tRNA synthetase (class II)